MVREEVKLVEISNNQQPLIQDDFMLMIKDGMPNVGTNLTPQWNQFISHAVKRVFSDVKVGREGSGDRRRIYTNLTLI